MRKYFDTVEDSLTGKPIAEAEVAVLTAPSSEGGVSATLFLSDGITPTDNPVVTDETGYFEFYIADGTYTLEISVGGEILQTIDDVQIYNVAGFGSIDGKLDADAVSAFGLTLIDDVDASTARTTLGLGTAAVAATGDFAATSHAHSASDVTSGSLALARGGTGVSLSDPGGDRLMFWDDSADSVAWLSLGAGLIITGTSIASTGGGGGSSVWGTISGTLTDQTDLVTALDLKLDDSQASAFGLTLLDDADAATARATLGLVIGTNVQAQDAELAAIAGLTSAADRLPYFTGSGTASLATFTAAGRALVDDADAAAQRTTLGLGSLATASTINGGNWSGTDLAVADGGTGASTLTGILKGNGTSAFTAVTAPSGTIVGDTDTITLTNKRVTPRIGTASGSGSKTPNADSHDEFVITGVSGTLTIANPSGTPTQGQPLIIRFKDDGTSRTVNWGAAWRAIGSSLPSATTIGKTTYVGALYNSTDSKWDAFPALTEV